VLFQFFIRADAMRAARAITPSQHASQNKCSHGMAGMAHVMARLQVGRIYRRNAAKAMSLSHPNCQ
jgi:hypothetical protein